MGVRKSLRKGSLKLVYEILGSMPDYTYKELIQSITKVVTEPQCRPLLRPQTEPWVVDTQILIAQQRQ